MSRHLARIATLAAIRQEMEQHPVERNPMQVVSDVPAIYLRLLRGESLPAARADIREAQARPVAREPAAVAVRDPKRVEDQRDYYVRVGLRD